MKKRRNKKSLVVVVVVVVAAAAAAVVVVPVSRYKIRPSGVERMYTLSQLSPIYICFSVPTQCSADAGPLPYIDCLNSYVTSSLSSLSFNAMFNLWTNSVVLIRGDLFAPTPTDMRELLPNINLVKNGIWKSHWMPPCQASSHCHDQWHMSSNFNSKGKNTVLIIQTDKNMELHIHVQSLKIAHAIW